MHVYVENADINLDLLRYLNNIINIIKYLTKYTCSTWISERINFNSKEKITIQIVEISLGLYIKGFLNIIFSRNKEYYYFLK